MIDHMSRIAAALYRRLDDRAASIHYYGWGGRAWTGRGR